RRKELTMSLYQQFGRVASENETFGRAKPKAIAEHCGHPKGHGQTWKCDCPVCRKCSLSVTPKLSFLVYCHYCAATDLNDGHTEQRVRLIEAGLIDPDENLPNGTKKQPSDTTPKRRAEAQARWNSGFIEPITPDRCAAKYLRVRGLEAFIDHPALRCTAS